VIAHRGASGELTENTLPAFERAIEEQADFVELDVHPSPEGELVVTHDPPRPGVAYPALSQVLELCRGRIGVMVELKTPYRYRRERVVERTLALLDDDAVIVCFEPGAIAAVRSARPRLRTIQHVASVPIAYAERQGCWAVGFDEGHAGPRAVQAARRAGLATTVYTVNAEPRMLELAALGVTGLFTDFPRRARACLAHLPPG
jgi:glycerophosphoryl diester phosphodiesterase